MDTQTGHILIQLARRAIATRLGVDHNVIADKPHWLEQPGASWVTLLYDNKIRGRTGTLKAHRTLADDVTANAVAAACSDPRFKPLTPGEFTDTRIEICLLSALEPVNADDEAAAIAQLRPGVDGAIFEYGRHHSSFLPEAWNEAENPADFLAQLKYRAGLPPDFWDRGVKLARYTVMRWHESGIET